MSPFSVELKKHDKITQKFFKLLDPSQSVCKLWPILFAIRLTFAEFHDLRNPEKRNFFIIFKLGRGGYMFYNPNILKLFLTV